ncbi:catalase family peroxidase [Saccharibacillus sp. CPCC 101409]|uniref:catalase family peroxidase n=1 Tax=Saccharibacillus sp. CPCC 101409 TaxID=3058041 RepID=UPI002672E741|nr:catalase family peroxidase [Saccharibacillus sp. CPCC 101409]MDO3409925.1 catalase family peroxidase [Saccharibacillus sp. CPCC 101409]
MSNPLRLLSPDSQAGGAGESDPIHFDPAADAVDELESVSGVHAGYRRAHARGICCRASFLPSGKAAAFTTAPHLQEREIKAIVRFSGSSTDPGLADLLSPAKGMAVQFLLPEGGRTNLVGVTVPVFFARTPQSFMEMLTTLNRTRAGRMSKSEALKNFARHFGESRQSLLALKRLKPPVSYAANLYYCIHAYLLVDDEGRRRPVKFEWIPDAGVQTLSIHEAAAQPDDYLESELRTRLGEQPASFRLSIVLGEEGDPTDDPTKRWPSDRRRIDAGRLVVLEPVDEPAGLVMDPTVIPDGVALSDDPILRFRRDTYAESFKRRSAEH